MSDEPITTNDATPDDAVGLPEVYVIPRALAQATLEYLASQPYREVFALVRGFEALEPIAPRDAEHPAQP